MVGATAALVTGASRGIGLAVAGQLLGLGWAVWLSARDEARAEAAAEGLEGDVRPVALDVTDPASIERALGFVAEMNSFHCLINNAGIDFDADQTAARADLARVRRVFETNLFGAWACAQAAAPILARRPHSVIVNVSSEAGSLATMAAGPPGYATAKAALNALTRLLAAELRSQGTLVNAVCPGWTATDMGRGGRPVEDDAASVVWAATLPSDGPTGGFFRDGRALP
jgi:NAD(P)-dependent dehydrogenase (short-subunit alcohol dehydrogenase family)